MGIIRLFSAVNFKALGPEPMTIELAPVTLLFGPNSAGKSTLIQAIHYAYEVLMRHNLDADKTERGGTSIELGGFKNVVHRGEERDGLSLEFRIDLSDVDIPQYVVDYHTSWADLENTFSPADHVQSADVFVHVQWSDLMRRPYVSEYRVITVGPQAWIKCSPDGKEVWLDYFHRVRQGVPPPVEADEPDEFLLSMSRLLRPDYVDEVQSSVRVPLAGTRDALPNWGEVLSIPFEYWEETSENPDRRAFTEQMSRFVVGPGELLTKELARMTYIGPLREVPDREIQPARSPDSSRWAAGLAAWDLLAGRAEQLAPVVNQWLAQPSRFDTGYSIVVDCYREVPLNSPLGVALSGNDALDAENLHESFSSLPERSRIRLVDQSKGMLVAPRDLGVGLSQLIPVIVASVSGSSGLVMIEQPELHMHPAVQVQLGDLFIDAANAGRGPFLIETHSEHLLLRILRRIRETTAGEVPPGQPTCRKEQVAVYFVESDLESKAALVRRLRVTDDGDFSDPWPRGFFDERDAELF